MWYCSECGKKNSGKFCTRCGTKYVEVDDNPPVFARNDVSHPSVDESQKELAKTTTADDFAETDFEPSNASALCRRGDEIKTVCSEEKAAAVASEIPADSEEVLAELKSSDDTSITEVREEAEATVPDPIFLTVLTSSDDTEESQSSVTLAEDASDFDVETVTVVSPAEEEFPSAADAPVAEHYDDAETEVSPQFNPQREKNADSEDDDIWVAPFLREKEEISEAENGTADFLRIPNGGTVSSETAEADTASGIAGIFSHRLPSESNSDKEWKYSKRLLISVGAVGGVVLVALLILLGSLLFNVGPKEEKMPESTGIYYYVSGVKESTPLYAEASINSDVLAKFENGAAVEFLEKANAEFILVFDKESEQYGYIRSSCLVDDKKAVDYGNVDNKYDEEKSLGYYYVTKTKDHLTLWENPDGGGVVKAKLKNGYKVSLLEKTNEKYWYVFDYNSAERGYVRVAYLTDDKSKVVGIYREPKDKTIIGDLFVVNVKQYLPIWSEPSSGSTFRGKLLNGEKVGLIQKTTGSYWYVYGYSNGVYGWVSTAYLGNAPEQKEDTSQNYVVTGTQEYLPVLSEAVVGGNEIGQIHNGDAVTVLDSSGDTFWYVSVPSLGIKGYVVKDYLKK